MAGETKPKLSAVTRARMAWAHLECAKEAGQPSRLEHQISAERALRRALEALAYEREADR